MALYERSKSGQGQVVDTAMTEGAAYLFTFLSHMYNSGSWKLKRGENLLDGGAPFYDSYLTKDGKWMSVGSLEPNFYGQLLSVSLISLIF